MEASTVAHSTPALVRSPRFVKALTDESLVDQVRAGNKAAFEEVYDRFHRGMLSFCRHMLGSAQEAEDAVQQTFLNAYQDLVSTSKPINLRPWLFRIARNRCLSVLRSRVLYAEATGREPSTVNLSEEVERRSDLRALLADINALPFDQRASLLLAELSVHSHREIAEIVDCDIANVKALVYQARASLSETRQAREASCRKIREQLSTLRGGALRRNLIKRHLRECEGCRMFRDETRRQRRAMAVVLPVLPSFALKGKAMAAVGIAGGGSAGGAAATAGSSALAGGTSSGGVAATGSGLSGAVAGKIGLSSAAGKVVTAAIAATVITGGAIGVSSLLDGGAGEPAGAESQLQNLAVRGETSPIFGDLGRGTGKTSSSGRSGKSSDFTAPGTSVPQTSDVDSGEVTGTDGVAQGVDGDDTSGSTDGKAPHSQDGSPPDDPAPSSGKPSRGDSEPELEKGEPESVGGLPKNDEPPPVPAPSEPGTEIPPPPSPPEPPDGPPPPKSDDQGAKQVGSQGIQGEAGAPNSS